MFKNSAEIFKEGRVLRKSLRKCLRIPQGLPSEILKNCLRKIGYIRTKLRSRSGLCVPNDFDKFWKVSHCLKEIVKEKLKKCLRKSREILKDAPLGKSDTARKIF